MRSTKFAEQEKSIEDLTSPGYISVLESQVNPFSDNLIPSFSQKFFQEIESRDKKNVSSFFLRNLGPSNFYVN